MTKRTFASFLIPLTMIAGVLALSPEDARAAKSSHTAISDTVPQQSYSLAHLQALSTDGDAPYDFDPLKRTALVIDKAQFLTIVLQIQEDGRPHPVLIVPNSHGKLGYETPTGLTAVSRIVLDPSWQNPWTGARTRPYSQDRNNPMGVAAIMLDNGIGLHGTNDSASVPRQRISHSCVRHNNQDILKLVASVVPGTKVLIVERVEASTSIVSSAFSW